MDLIIFALIGASVFAGAAAYINFSEQPARLALDDAAMLKQWKPSYAKGFRMQASLALISGLLGLASFAVTQNYAALAGGLLMLANWPYTLIVIMPVNKALGATAEADANNYTRALVKRWGSLHVVRTTLGLCAVACFAVAL